MNASLTRNESLVKVGSGDWVGSVRRFLTNFGGVYGVVNLKIKRCHPELASAGRERDLTSARTAGVVLRIYATVCICPVLILHMPMPIRKHRRIPLPLGQRVRDDISWE